jgi:hypothetical protein
MPVVKEFVLVKAQTTNIVGFLAHKTVSVTLSVHFKKSPFKCTNNKHSAYRICKMKLSLWAHGLLADLGFELFWRRE